MSQVLNRSIPKLLLTCESFASAIYTLKSRGRRKSKRKSSTSLVKIEEEDPQDVPIEIRAQHNDLLDDFDPDSDDLDLGLQLEEDIRLEQQLHERELQRELSPSVVFCRTLVKFVSSSSRVLSGVVFAFSLRPSHLSSLPTFLRQVCF